MSLVTFYLYLATWALVALSPGPAAMCVMSQSARHGVRASFAGIGGIQTGNLIFFACIALGLASLLTTATTAFTVLRWMGAAYMLYLGVRIIAATFRAPADGRTEKASAGVPRGLFLQGLLIQLTNPKALLFVSALLPQFVEPERPFALQIAILLGVTVMVDVLVMWGYALLASQGSRAMKSPPLMLWTGRMLGGALVFFGLRLVAVEK